MKIRNGFVSNSSSSSFIVIDNRKNWFDHSIWVKDDITVPYPDEDSASSFDWGPNVYIDFGSRLNFAAIMAKGNQAEEDLIFKVLQKYGCKSLKINFRPDEGYIDHQSSRREKPENGRMFESEETLERWLFGAHSMIYEDNDNENVFDQEAAEQRAQSDIDAIDIYRYAMMQGLIAECANITTCMNEAYPEEILEKSFELSYKVTKLQELAHKQREKTILDNTYSDTCN